MTKQELMENYTMEQLADMVIEKYNREKSEERPYGAHYDLEDGKAIRFIGFEREDAEPLFALIHERITEKPMSLYPSDKLLQEVGKIKSLKEQLQRKETIINQIDDILNELFGVTHDAVSTPDKLKEILKEKIEHHEKENIKLREQIERNKYAMMQVDDVLVGFFGRRMRLWIIRLILKRFCKK